ARLVRLEDQEARFLWRWFVRLARLTALYFMAAKALLPHVGDPTLHFLIRGGLLLVFPVLLTAFLPRLALLLRVRTEKKRAAAGTRPAEPVSPGLRARLAALAGQYWTFPAVAYVWILFLFAVGGFKAGFRYLFTGTLGTAATVLGALLALAGLLRLFRRAFPGDEPGEARLYRVFQAAAQAVVGLVAVLALAWAWGLPISNLFYSRTGLEVLSRLLAIVLTVGAVALVWEGSQFLTNRLLEERAGATLSQKRKTLTPIVNTAVKTAAVFVGGVVILDRLSVNVGPILAGAGIIGLGVGLGAQSLVKDVINGLFILFQDMIAVGDIVKVGDKDGQVEALSLRSVRLRDLAGNVHVIPNGTIDTYTNMTKTFSRYVIDLGVAYREDPDKVMALLEEIGRELQADPKFGPDILAPLEIFGLERFDESAVVIRVRLTTRPMQQWTVGREFNRRIKKAFDQHGIEIPFPHRTIYMGEAKSSGDTIADSKAGDRSEDGQ
ncbi:MAG: mechanosensitive ion channel family protein, partial [Thermodesulfobacteriota bacterium]